MKKLVKKMPYFIVLVALVIVAVIVYSKSTGGTDKKGSTLFYNFYDNFNSVKISRNDPRTDNLWKKSIANIIINNYNKKQAYYNKRGIFELPFNEFDFDISIPSKKKIEFKSLIGNHPLARTWGSDGFRMTVNVVSDGKTEALVNEYVDGTSDFRDISADLSKYAGKTVTLKFIATNDKDKNGQGDWPIWGNPQLMEIK